MDERSREAQSFRKLCELTGRLLNLESAPDRDRRLQVFLAQARSPVRNGDLLRAAVARAVGQAALREGNEVNASMADPLMETLTAITEALDSRGIQYAITGSVASSLHGEPFQSLDVDLILVALPSQSAELAKALAPRFYAPEERLVEASRNGGFVNVIDNATSLKADLSFVADEAFLRQCLQRRVPARIGSDPHEFWFVTAEDVILMKLLWRRETRSAKQWENALSVARVKGARMDWAYLFEQARAIGIEEELTHLRDEAGI